MTQRMTKPGLTLGVPTTVRTIVPMPLGASELFLLRQPPGPFGNVKVVLPSATIGNRVR
jgi:hypothetical protein